MSKKRPFVIGDLAIHKDYDKGTVENITAIMVSIRFNVGLLDFYDDRDIKTIRTPRKGSAESRAIVAMSGRLYHRSLLSFLKTWLNFCGDKDRDLAIKNYWETRKKGGFNEQNAHYLHFEKGRAMLK